MQRTRIPISTVDRNRSAMMSHGSQQVNIGRQPLGILNQNAVLKESAGGYGLSAGMRVGKQTDSLFNRSGGGTPHASQMGPPQFNIR